MLTSKVIEGGSSHELEKYLNEFLRTINAEQIVNLYYAANGTDYGNRRFSIVLLYNKETTPNNIINETN